MTTDYPKKPSTYLSFATNNPTTKRHIYFTCPIVAKYGYGHDSKKERTDGTQDFRDKVRKVLGWAIRDGKITAEEYNTELEIGYDAIKTAEKEERNEPKYNPEYLEWVENKPKRTPATKTKKEPKEHTENRYVMLENRNTELMRQMEDMVTLKTHENMGEEYADKITECESIRSTMITYKKEVNELTEEVARLSEENDDLTYNLEHESKTNEEYEEMYERKEYYKKLYNDLVAEQNKPKVEPKKTKTKKTYNTKNKVIDDVIEELVEDCIDL